LARKKVVYRSAEKIKEKKERGKLIDKKVSPQVRSQTVRRGRAGKTLFSASRSLLKKRKGKGIPQKIAATSGRLR